MKNILNYILLLFAMSCSIHTYKPKQSANKLIITQVDSVKNLYVFNCKNLTNSLFIIIAEKQQLANCKPFKKFILLDSVKETTMIKTGSRPDIIGFDELTIDGVKVKKAGELTKIINNCEALVDK